MTYGIGCVIKKGVPSWQTWMRSSSIGSRRSTKTTGAPPSKTWARTPPSYFTGFIHQLVSESQLPHTIVNLLLTITDGNMKLTVLWGS